MIYITYLFYLSTAKLNRSEWHINAFGTWVTIECGRTMAVGSRPGDNMEVEAALSLDIMLGVVKGIPSSIEAIIFRYVRGDSDYIALAIVITVHVC
jgi:hypothetical protein